MTNITRVIRKVRDSGILRCMMQCMFIDCSSSLGKRKEYFPSFRSDERVNAGRSEYSI